MIDIQSGHKFGVGLSVYGPVGPRAGDGQQTSRAAPQGLREPHGAGVTGSCRGGHMRRHAGPSGSSVPYIGSTCESPADIAIQKIFLQFRTGRFRCSRPPAIVRHSMHGGQQHNRKPSPVLPAGSVCRQAFFCSHGKRAPAAFPMRFALFATSWLSTSNSLAFLSCDIP